MERDEMWMEDLEWIEDDQALANRLDGVLVLFAGDTYAVPNPGPRVADGPDRDPARPRG